MDSYKPLAVFDLDGTLNRTELHCIPSQIEAMKRYGVEPLPRETLMSMIGAPSYEYARVLVPNLSGDELAGFFKYSLELDKKYVKEFGKCYDGIPQAIEKLRKMGINIAVCSNSSEAYITSILEGIGISGLIDYIRPIIKPYDKTYSLKQLLTDVPHSAAVMIGDTKYDSKAASDNGIPFVGCLYGYGKKDMLNEVYSVSSPSEIPELIIKILK